VHFLSPDGNGMYSTITECKENELMAFKHLGEVKKFEEQSPTDVSKSWVDAREVYSLKENKGKTELKVSMDSIEGFADYMKKTFPVALNIVKELAENPVQLIIETNVGASVEKVWRYWTLPEHIIKWNKASDDWHCPSAMNDLKAGGSFSCSMAANDGSFSFEFSGIYDVVNTHEKIQYTLEDGRKVIIDFIPEGTQTKIVESFEAEETNSLDLQQGGWQAILNNFKNYTETN
jgi:uncharacterized protein YndB with AHSA1/START domain